LVEWESSFVRAGENSRPPPQAAREFDNLGESSSQVGRTHLPCVRSRASARDEAASAAEQSLRARQFHIADQYRLTLGRRFVFSD